MEVGQKDEHLKLISSFHREKGRPQVINSTLSGEGIKKPLRNETVAMKSDNDTMRSVAMTVSYYLCNIIFLENKHCVSFCSRYFVHIRVQAS